MTFTTSPPSSSFARAAPHPPTSSITLLGHAFSKALNTTSCGAPTSDEAWQNVTPPASSAWLPWGKGKVEGSANVEEERPGRRVAEDDDDDIQDTDEEDTQLPTSSAPLPRSSLKRKSESLEEAVDCAPTSTPTLTSQVAQQDSKDSIASDTPSIAKQEEDAIMENPVATAKLQVPKKRSPEEIAAAREAALAKRAASLKAKEEEAAKVKQEAQNNPIAKELQRQARHKQRLEVASLSLGQFGFKVQTPGVSRYGSGSGGLKAEPGDSPALDAFGMPILTLPPSEYAPNEDCSEEQRSVLEAVKAGGNVFFTGSAGVGKSFLLSEITRLLDFLKRPFQVVAPTGIAALNVNGVTIHSWSGVGLGKDAIVEYYDKMNAQPTNRESKKRNWIRTKTLIIDEISMLEPDLFSKLSTIGKLLRKDSSAFGGLQLIVCGDFFQLPPVPNQHPKCIRCGEQPVPFIKPEESTLPFEPTPAGVKPSAIRKCVGSVRMGERIEGCGLEWRSREFCFETEAWAECNFKVMELTKVFRQSDPEFVRVLEKFRRGICDEESEELIKGCGSALKSLIKIKPTNLYPLRASVDNENTQEFAKLGEPVHVFDAYDASMGPYAKTVQRERLKDVPAAPKIQLKKGAQVLLLANLDLKSGLVNGSRGCLVDWIPANQCPDDDEYEAQHAKPAMGSSRRFGGEEWREQAASEFLGMQRDEYYPMVIFANGETRVIRPHSVARTQIPLALAWALTIHKSQGQSLDAVGVRMSNVFEKGQAYVALSRCRTPAGMKVEGFKKSLIMAHETVAIFYKRIAANLPYRDVPPPPTNPLDFLPTETPLLIKLAYLFGPPRPALPAGSALPQIPFGTCSHLKAEPDETAFPSAAGPTANPFANDPRPATTWEAILRQAATEYATNTGLGGGIDVFVDQARQTVARAMADMAFTPPVIKPEPRDEGLMKSVKAEPGTLTAGTARMVLGSTATPLVKTESMESIKTETDDSQGQNGIAGGRGKPRKRRKKKASFILEG